MKEFFTQRRRKFRDFEKKLSIRNIAKIALIPNLALIFSPETLITRNRCEIIFKSYFENRGGRLSTPCPDWLRQMKHVCKKFRCKF